MRISKKITLAVTIALIFISCATRTKPIHPNSKKAKTVEFEGDYASDDYRKKNEGYDWVAVSVKKTGDSTYHIAVRSRADIKKPTCTFDADAMQLDSNKLVSNIQGKNVLFFINDSILHIATERPEDMGLLNYFCSGGGSLAGQFIKIKVPLDKTQIDPRIFQKVLSLQNIGFDISSAGDGSIQQLTILPYGLTVDNKKITEEVMGIVTDAEIEDLNSDGYPEILIYTTSSGSGSYGDVIGYSVNNGKSMSRISFPEINDNKEASTGYMGHDQFQIVETTLVQRFQLYNSTDVNAGPTGKIRQIQYKLKDGESSRIFVIDKIVEYPAK